MATKKNNLLPSTYSEELEFDGLTYDKQIVHMLNTQKVMFQIFDLSNGVDLEPSKYSFIRDSLNTCYIKFIAPPIARSKYCIMIMKVE